MQLFRQQLCQLYIIKQYSPPWGGGGKEEGEQLKEIVGLVGEPSEVLARTVGDGVRKMMKKREGGSDRGVLVYIYVCYLYLTHLVIRTKRQKGRESVV